LTADGLERTFAVNHLAPFLLTNLLLDLLKASAPARIINVSSSSHLRGRIHFEDLSLKGRYGPMVAYQQSKLANMLFTRELSRRLAGSGVMAFAMHPGLVATNIAANNGLLVRLFLKIFLRGARSPEKGAETILYLASSPEVAGQEGRYFVDNKPAPTSLRAQDSETARRLWEVSEALTGLKPA
jgi:NAD(P)-dependent dehydrogenase (short-subunit alcohol dehydrogenase family)